MSTRKLILAALVCGLAILVAGGVLLLRLSTSEDPSEGRIVAVGTSQTIGTSEAVVEAWRVDGSEVTLTVSVTAGEGGVEDLRAAWSLIGPKGLVERAPAGDDECPAAPLAFEASSSCSVRFELGSDDPADADDLTAFFRAGGRSAGWALDPA